MDWKGTEETIKSHTQGFGLSNSKDEIALIGEEKCFVEVG